MFKEIKEFFFGKPQAAVVEAPYKVETPAFKGAVLRNEVDVGDFEKESFVEKYEPIMNIKSADLRDTASRIFAAFNLVDKLRQATIAKTEEDLPEDFDLEIDEDFEETAE